MQVHTESRSDALRAIANYGAVRARLSAPLSVSCVGSPSLTCSEN